MAVPESDQIATSAAAPPEKADYDATRFWHVARRYGLWNLVGTSGSLVALLAGGGVLFLFLEGWLKLDGLKALGVAYISLGAALFGVVLAGLAVVAAFFDREYVRSLQDSRVLDLSLFVFWWVAALAVFSLLLSVGLTVAAYAGASRTVMAVALALATVFFVSALMEALALVGTMMRHGLYRAQLDAPSTDEIKASRTNPQL